MSLDSDTALIRDYHSNTDRFMDRLAVLMSELLPTNTKVTRQKAGLFRRTETVTGITMTIDNLVLTAQRQSGPPTFTLQRMARGVVLRRESLNAQQWLDALKTAIANQADALSIDPSALARLD